MILTTKIFKNSIWSFAGFLWPIGLIFLSIPYFIRELGIEQYGIWVLISSSVGILEVFNLGVGDALIKFVSEYHAKDDFTTVSRIIANCFIINIAISVAVILISLLFLQYFVVFFNIPSNYKDTVILVLKISIFSFVITLFMTNALCVFKGFQRYDLSSITIIVTDTIRILGMIFSVSMGFALEGMVIANTGGSILGLFFTLILLKRFNPQISLRPSFEKEIIKKIVSFSFFSSLAGISSIIRANVGNILVGKFLGSPNVPYFSIPFQVSNKLLAAMASLTMVLFPVFSSVSNKDQLEKIRRVFIGATKLVVTLGFAIGGTMIIFSNAILSLWITPSFAIIADDPFKILLISFMFTIAATTSYFLLMGRGRIKIIAAMQNLTMIMILGLGIALLPKYSVTGISLAYALGNATLIIYIFYAIKTLGAQGHPNEVLLIFLPALASLFMGVLLFSGFLTLRVTTVIELFSYVPLLVLAFMSFTAILDYHSLRKYWALIARK